VKTAHLNPPTLLRSPAFSQAVVVSEPGATIYVGGQNAITVDGQIVGDDLATQTTRALANLEAALAAAGATIHDVVRWTITVVNGQPLADGVRAFAQKWGDAADPPAISVHLVAGLAHPQYLVEIDAIAAIAATGTG
jgi:enamine deaminase RidA (YjgF/YER057c/UK114 family)